MNIIGLVDSIGRDLRFALRALLRRPTFTLAAVFTLALGIGATTAIFSVVYSVLIKPLPYPNAEELVRIRHVAPGLNFADMPASPTQYFTYRDENRTFAALGLWQEDGQTLTDPGEPERLRTVRVTHGVLQALAVRPLLGRWFIEAEHGPKAEGTSSVILSHEFWQRRYGGDERVLGREISIDSQTSKVVGVMPRGFQFLDMSPQPDLITAVQLDRAREVTGGFGYQALGRLKPESTIAEAVADLEQLQTIWLESWPLMSNVTLTRESIVNWHIAPRVRALKEDLVGDVANTLWVLMAGIGAVLLVACANIANLMLVRADARRHEFAVRAALGARPRQLAREVFVESAIIGLAGATLGLTLAYFGLEVLVIYGPNDLPRLREVSVYPPVIAFTVSVALVSTLVFGSITAFKHRLHTEAPTFDATRSATASRQASSMRSTLVIVQVALALVLVVGALLMIRTFEALHNVEPGFDDPASIQTARIWVPGVLAEDPRRYTRLQQEMLDAIAAIPGVAAAGFASQLPIDGLSSSSAVAVEGDALPPGATPPPRKMKQVSPGFLAAMGTRIIAGRDISWNDVETGGRVALISEEFARELALEPAQALGKRIRMNFAQDAWHEVIGVVQSVHEDGLYKVPPSFVYWPALMEDFVNQPVIGTQAAAFVVRSERAGTASLVEEVRQAIWSVNRGTAIGIERTMLNLYSGSLARTSFTLVMLAIAGGMAMLLGVVGIYGVIAHVVSRRTREIGIRSALGAEPRRLTRMFLLHGLALSAAGAAVGLVAAMALGRVMSSLLFGISPMDPAAYAVALGIMIAAAALASYMPARRAANINPIDTLRAE
jgi:putative ABC transport system permease protein